MKKTCSHLLGIVLLLCVSLLVPRKGFAQGGIVAGATTGVVVNEVTAGLKEVINHGADRGEYLVAKSAIEMLGVLDAWKKTNESLLNTAFDKLDKTQRDMFANARQLVFQANQAAKDNLETAERITQNANQIAESLPFSKGRSYVLGQHPRVLHPSVRDTIVVKLTGVNLDLADAQLVLGGGHRARRSQLGAQEVMFRVPMAALIIDTTKFQLHTLRFTHFTRKGGLFNPKEQVSREIEIATLPRTVGRFSFTGTRKFQNRETKQFTADAGRFSGKNESVNRIAHPENGWRWDLTQPITAVSTGSGEAGRCSEILMNDSNENGIVVRARLDAINEIFRHSGGYKYCGAQGTIYRMVDAEGPIPALDGRITWMQDLVVPMPTDTKDFALQVNLFTNEGRTFTNADQCQYFTVVKEPGRLVIHPTIPKGVDL